MDVESPLKGWPQTEPLKGQAGYRVRARHLTPQRVKFMNKFCYLMNLGSFILFFWVINVKILVTDEELYIGFGAVTAVCVFLWATRRHWGRVIFGKTTIIEFMPERIRIKGYTGFKNYDRTLPHEFDYRIHEKAEQEHEQEIEKRRDAAKKGKELNAEKYFRQSFHVILRYAGQRVDVADIFGRKQAEALLVRLQLLDQFMDAARGEPGSPAFSEPSTQYGERPEEV